MTDTKNKSGKTLGLRGGSNTVKQSFSHGRSKQVVVETKRKRTINKPGVSGAPNPKQDVRQTQAVGNTKGMNSSEIERRRKAVEAARAQESERKARIQAEEKARAEEIERLRQEKEEAERREAEEEAKRVEAEKKEKAEKEKAEAEAKAAQAAKAKSNTAKSNAAQKPAQKRQPEPAAKPAEAEAQPSQKPANPRKVDVEKPVREDKSAKPKGGDDRRRGKLTINQALNDDDGSGRGRSAAAMRRRQEKAQRKQKGNANQPREKVIRDVQLPDAITVQELANRMAERVADVIKSLMATGTMATQNQSIDAETAEFIIEEFGHRVQRVSDSDVEDIIHEIVDDEKDLEPRAPIITIMGHVDHGKTSLLDRIRKANVVSGEAGGITQHIGAYQVTTESGAVLSFLDTPGHAAFTSMRARGATVTDIVVLVVAANDGVKPQTIEAINHAKAANVPMIVAINKIDLPEADPNKARTDLLQHEVVVEAMSGDVQDVPVSAHTGEGLNELLEAIALQAEILELKANPNRSAEGAVIEAQLDVGRGPVATVLVQKGTLRRGDIFVVGQQYGKVRALINDQGERVDEAGPSVPVEVLGLNGTPEAGDILHVVPDEARAREIAEYRAQADRDRRAALGAATTLDQLLAQKKATEDMAELPVLVKADVQGSAEAIVQALEKIGNDEVRVRVLHSGVGAITESDINLAEASQAPIIGFNVRANSAARDSANQKGIELRYYSIIYDLVDDVKSAAAGLLSPEVKETFIGYAKIKEVFKITGAGKVAGCIVTEGTARRHAGVRLLRDNVVIHEGKLKTLKRFKDEVKEVFTGQECGMAFENYEDIREDDIIEIYTTQEIERSL